MFLNCHLTNTEEQVELEFIIVGVLVLVQHVTCMRKLDHRYQGNDSYTNLIP